MVWCLNVLIHFYTPQSFKPLQNLAKIISTPSKEKCVIVMSTDVLQNEKQFDIRSLFERVNEVYKVSNDAMYASTNGVNGMHLSVLPSRKSNVFTQYSFGDNADVTEIWEIYQRSGESKTVGCGLCRMSDPRNTVVITDRLGVLQVDHTAPALVYEMWSHEGRSYRVSGTLPQYYTNHLLMVSESHIPTYGVFFNYALFSDVYAFLEECNVPETVAIFNGAAGSDRQHFHVHLTDTRFNFITAALENVDLWEPQGINMLGTDIINAVVIHSRELRFVYESAMKFVYTAQLEQEVITANFLLVNSYGYYVCILHSINRARASVIVNGCEYNIIPAGYTIIANCYNVLPGETDAFIQEITNGLSGLYRDYSNNPVIVERFKRYTPEQIITYITNPANVKIIVGDDVYESPEQLWAVYAHEDSMGIPPDISLLVRSLVDGTITNSDCAKITIGRIIRSVDFVQLLSVLSDPILHTIRIDAEYNNLFHFDGPNGAVSTGYMYFRGEYLMGLIQSTFANLLLITSIGTEGDGVHTVDRSIGEWLDYVYAPIGEPSAMGVATIGKLKGTPLSFVVKVLYIKNTHEYLAFNHEFQISIRVNAIRRLVPNYIQCFGGFKCMSSDKKKLCDGGSQPFGYLLLENVDRSETLNRHIKLPAIASATDVEDELDGVYQIMNAIAIGHTVGDFTHNDLHTDNIMVYNFIQRKEFLNMSLLYTEHHGDTVPYIRTVIFTYHYPDGSVVYVPAKKLYLIIDYGQATMTGVNDDFLTKDYPYVTHSDTADVYTFLMHYYLNVIVYKPWLMIDAGGNWLDNSLTHLFAKFLEAYSSAFNDTSQAVMDGLLFISNNTVTHKLATVYAAMYNYIAEPLRINARYAHYLRRSFTPDLVAPDFRGAREVVRWMTDTLYITRVIDLLLPQSTTIRYNWGYTPPGMNNGIDKYSESVLDEQLKRVRQDARIANVELFDLGSFVSDGSREGMSEVNEGSEPMAMENTSLAEIPTSMNNDVSSMSNVS